MPPSSRSVPSAQRRATLRFARQPARTTPGKPLGGARLGDGHQERSVGAADGQAARAWLLAWARSAGVAACAGERERCSRQLPGRLCSPRTKLAARTKCAVRTPAGCDGGAADRQAARARAAGIGTLEGQMLLAVATWQGKGCGESQPGRARAAASHDGGRCPPYPPADPADGAPTPSAVESNGRLCALAGCTMTDRGPRSRPR